MTYQYHDRDVSCSVRDMMRFSAMRIRRLYPLHIVTAIAISGSILYGVYANFGMTKWRTSLVYSLINLTLMHAWIPRSSVYFWLNGVSWYLSVCMFLYFLYPLIHKWIRKQNGKTALHWCFIIYGFQLLGGMLSYVLSRIPIITILSDGFPKWFTYIFPIYRAGDFVIGAMLGLVYIEYGSAMAGHLRGIGSTLMELGAILMFVFSHLIHVYHIGPGKLEAFRYTTLYTPSTCLLVLAIALQKGFFTRCISNRIGVSLGELSPYGFLIHYVVISNYGFLSTFHPVPMDRIIKSLICLGVSIALSVIWKKYVTDGILKLRGNDRDKYNGKRLGEV